jgi:hypothetical protein
LTKPRIFLSSVIEGFEAYRQAARRGIKSAGGEPLLVNEDMPSRNASSRTACLDAVASADVYVAVIGERGGWTTPSGKLVVEEEYEEARRRDLPVLVFLERTARDESAERLANRLSDYTGGYFRTEFDGPDGLEREVRQAVEHLFEKHQATNIDLPEVQALARDRQGTGQGPALRLALGPERREEVISPVRLERKPFRFEVYQLAHALDTEVLNYERPKQSEVQRKALVITEQSGGQRSGGGPPTARLEIRETGDLAIDLRLLGRNSGQSFGMGGVGNMAVTTGSIEAALRRALRFCETLYDTLDGQGRHTRFGYNVTVTGLGHRQIVSSAPTGNAGSISLRQQQTPVLAYDAPRPITRSTLASEPGDDIERAALRLKQNSRGQEDDPSGDGPQLGDVAGMMANM